MQRLTDEETTATICLYEHGFSARAISRITKRNWHSVQKAIADNLGAPLPTPPHRCPTCGSMILTSVCLACRDRQGIANAKCRGESDF